MGWIQSHGARTLGLGLALVASGACSEERAAEVVPAQSPLEIPIIDCQTKNAACIGANLDPSATNSCAEDLKQCLVDAAPTLQELAKTLLACEESARECLANTADPQQITACSGELAKCVESALPPLPSPPGSPEPPLPPRPGSNPPPSAAGAPAPKPPLPPSASGAPAPQPPPPPSASGAPAPQPPASPPGVPDLGLPPLPGAPGPLPEIPCIQDLLDCLSAGTDPQQCADQARECAQKALPPIAGSPGSQPGGQPPAPGGGKRP